LKDRNFRILFAITGHGYGHATRSLAIAKELLAARPGVDILFSTTVPVDFLARARRWSSPEGDIDPGYRMQGYEPGTAESNCFQVDVEATKRLYRTFEAERERRIEEETSFLASGGYRGVISDIAAVPIAAAARAGIPSVAVSNFTWDWILRPVLQGDPALERIPAAIASDYLGAEIYLRLPFHPSEHPFRGVHDVPIVGRRSRYPAGKCRRLLGLPESSPRPMVLVAIGGLRAGDWPRVEVRTDLDLDFLVVGDLPILFPPGRARFLPDRLPADLGFEDLVGMVDAVLSKPGYGMASECAANGTPFVLIERIGFAETAAIRSGIARYVPSRDLPLPDFFAGRWDDALEGVLSEGRKAPPEEDGARECALKIVQVFGL
jgi:hypothetical protein